MTDRHYFKYLNRNSIIFFKKSVFFPFTLKTATHFKIVEKG